MTAIYYPGCRAILSVTFDNFDSTPPELEGPPDGLAPTVVEIIPQQCSVQINSYKEADTFDMTFDLKKLPISPEQIRGAACQIYMYNRQGLHDDEAKYLTIDKCLLIGLIDNAEMTAGEDSTFHVTGRDYTGLLLDRKYPAKRITLGSTLKDTVQGLADEVTSIVGRGRQLLVDFQDSVPPPLVCMSGETMKVPKSKKRGITPSGKTYWDVIYDLCIRHGYIVFVRGVNIIITRPHVLTQGAATDATRVVFGNNLEQLQVSRKLSKEAIPQIVVRSYSSDARKVLEGRFPEKPNDAKTGIGTDKDNIKSFAVPGVTDPLVLRKMAENAYNSLSRGEGKISFSTKDLTDLAGKSLLELQAGGAVRIGLDSIAPDSTLQGLNAAQRRALLESVGVDAKVATVIANNYDKLDYFRTPFYITEVSLSWDSRNGIHISCDAKNFISDKRDDYSTAGHPIPNIPHQKHGRKPLHQPDKRANNYPGNNAVSSPEDYESSGGDYGE